MRNFFDGIEAEFVSRICPICGTSFEVYESSRVVYCRSDCENIASVRKNIESFLLSAGVPPILCGSRLTEFRNEADTERLIGWAKNPSANLVLYGDAGRGKSFIAASICRARIWRGDSVRWFNAANVGAALRGAYSDGGVSETKTIGSLLACKLAVVDDLGAESTSPSIPAQFYAIAEGRISAGSKTIWTTNLSSKEIADRYGDKFASRILSGMNLKVMGVDYRIASRGKK